MNGEEFYQYLMNTYYLGNQHINTDRFFLSWLPKDDGSFSFQFKFLNNIKSIPRAWLVEAKNADNDGEIITRDWFNKHFGQDNLNDCRASLAIWLLNNH